MAAGYPHRGLCGQDFSELFVPRGVGRDFLLRVLNVGIEVTVSAGSCPVRNSCQEVASEKQFKRENLKFHCCNSNFFGHFNHSLDFGLRFRTWGLK